MGLGLSIAREIVEAHGAQLTLTSQRGQGSTFSIELPLPYPVAK
jgi:signal transduction histidine kinase